MVYLESIIVLSPDHSIHKLEFQRDTCDTSRGHLVVVISNFLEYSVEDYTITIYGKVVADDVLTLDEYGLSVGSIVRVSMPTSDTGVPPSKESPDSTTAVDGMSWTVEPSFSSGHSTTTSVSTQLRRSSMCSVDVSGRAELSTSMVDVLSQAQGANVSMWPIYSSGAVLVATSSGGTQEMICIRPTVVRGEPLCYRDVGCITADGLASSLATQAVADTTMLLGSLTAEVHPSMVRLFAKQMGISDVEPAQLHQCVVNAMRSSSTVAVSCMDGSSWSLHWAFTSVGCSLVARVAQKKSAIVAEPNSSKEEDVSHGETAMDHPDGTGTNDGVPVCYPNEFSGESDTQPAWCNDDLSHVLDNAKLDAIFAALGLSD